jgi:hypothetical protein
MRRLILALVVVGALSATALAGAVGASGRADELAAVRAATAKFHSFEAAKAAGYGKFYVCTDETGAGAMGQHYVNGGLVGDAVLDPAAPEAIMYEPLPGGGQRLVGVEWVVFKSAWENAGHTGVPSLFGRSLKLVPEPNRYGIPTFYQLHAWIWKPNPTGTYQDWNPRVSCRGNGD